MQNSTVPLFECRTKDVVIRVEPEYLSEQSNPYDSRFFWAYTVVAAMRRCRGRVGRARVQHRLQASGGRVVGAGT